MAEGYLTKSATTSGGDRYLVHIHTDIETIKADGTGAESEIEDGRNVFLSTKDIDFFFTYNLAGFGTDYDSWVITGLCSTLQYIHGVSL